MIIALVLKAVLDGFSAGLPTLKVLVLDSKRCEQPDLGLLLAISNTYVLI